MPESIFEPEAVAEPAPVARFPSPEPPMRFDYFVILSRDAAACLEMPSFCRLRRCARAGYCIGKLKRREVPSELHPGKTFPVWLPLCIANTDDDWLQAFIIYWRSSRDIFFDRPIRPPEAKAFLPSRDEEWLHADLCSLETLNPFLKPTG
ncbi:hypothetical protein [Pararhizobium sp. O133]|uniref:hypothetical protein n=1 Tax=Pararhizobium sp. O133 TaxID=3449278 RepID=UPI003F6872E8